MPKFSWEKRHKNYLFNIAEYPSRDDLVWLQVDQSEKPIGDYVGWHGVESKRFTKVSDAFKYLGETYNYYPCNTMNFMLEA